MDWLSATVDYGVIGLLVVMSIIAVSIAVERMLVYRGIRLDNFADKKTLEITLTHKLHIIATIGSNAPYIGLLGTVLSIMLTFHTIGTEGMIDTSKIMTGLALALKATAIGLVVAIPSITFYNFLLRRVKVLVAEWEALNGRKRI